MSYRDDYEQFENSTAYEEGYSAGYEDGYRAAIKTVNEYSRRKKDEESSEEKE